MIPGSKYFLGSASFRLLMVKTRKAYVKIKYEKNIYNNPLL